MTDAVVVGSHLRGIEPCNTGCLCVRMTKWHVERLVVDLCDAPDGVVAGREAQYAAVTAGCEVRPVLGVQCMRQTV